MPGAVADDDQRAEAEAPAALHHLGDAVDVDDLLLELEAVGRRRSAAGCRPICAMFASLRTSGRPRARRRRPRARGRGRGSRCDRRRPRVMPFSWQRRAASRPDLLRGVDVGRLRRAAPRSSADSVDAASSVLPRLVGDHLRVDVLAAAEDGEPRARVGAAHARGARAPAGAARAICVCVVAISAVSRRRRPPCRPSGGCVSSAYLMPLPLYGSGGRSARIAAAVSPSSWRSAPSSVTTDLACSTFAVTPGGQLEQRSGASSRG